MNNIFKFAAIGLVSLAAASFTACDDDEEIIGASTEEINEEIAALSSQYINNVVYPTYTSLATNATTLYEASQTMLEKYNAGTLAQSDVDAACEAFKAAREQWELSEAWLYGAASDYEIDPHIDTWPLSQPQMVDFFTNEKMVNGLHSEDPVAFVEKNNGSFDSALGFHGVEFILFRDGHNRTYTDFAGIEKDESFSGQTVKCEEELYFLVAVTGDLANHCYWLEAAWKGTSAAHFAQASALSYATLKPSNGSATYYYGDNFLNAGKTGSTFDSKVLALVEVFEAGCSNICNEVYSQKLGQAWRVANGEGEKDDVADYIESPYSHRSFIDYRDNIYSIRNSLYGSLDGTVNTNSILKFLENNNYSGEIATEDGTSTTSATTLDNKLKAAIDALTTCQTELGSFVGNVNTPEVKAAIDAVQALDDELQAAKEWVSKL